MGELQEPVREPPGHEYHQGIPVHQFAFEDGRTEEARKVLLHLGQVRFGSPDEPTKAKIEALDNLGKLERLSERWLTVSSWEELLGEP